MSDDERGGGGKKGKGKGNRDSDGGGKDGGKGGGKGGGAGGKGGKRDGDTGPAVTRMNVVPNFIKDMKARLAPKENKRGLNHALLSDKVSPLGNNEDDEYDVEGAMVVGSEWTADDVRVLGRRKKPVEAKKTFFTADAPRPVEEDTGLVKFRGKSERTFERVGATSSAKRPGAKEGKESDGTGPEAVSAERRPAERERSRSGSGSSRGSHDGKPKARPGVGADRGARLVAAMKAWETEEKGRSGGGVGGAGGGGTPRKPAATVKRQRLSFDADDDG